MAVFTCLHPYWNTYPIASKRDAFPFDTQHRRALSANTLSTYHCDLLAAGTAITRAIDPIALADIDSYAAARNQSHSSSTRRLLLTHDLTA